MYVCDAPIWNSISCDHRSQVVGTNKGHESFILLKDTRYICGTYWRTNRLIHVVYRYQYYGCWALLRISTGSSHIRIYLCARPPSFPARARMSLLVCGHEFDAHVPPNGGELTNHSYHRHQQQYKVQCTCKNCKKHTVPFLSDSLPSFPSSSCPVEALRPWVSCEGLCGLWAAVKTKGCDHDEQRASREIELIIMMSLRRRISRSTFYELASLRQVCRNVAMLPLPSSGSSSLCPDKVVLWLWVSCIFVSDLWETER